MSKGLINRRVPRALGPRYPTRRPAHVAAWILYLRSHWLPMPPGLLAMRVLRKALGPGKS